MTASAAFLRVTNALLLLCGAALLGVGGWSAAMLGAPSALPDVPVPAAWAAPLLLAVGAGAGALGALGCCAASRSRLATLLYLGALQALYSALLAAAVACAVNLPKVGMYINDECAKIGCPAEDIINLEVSAEIHLRTVAIAAGSTAVFLLVSQLAAAMAGFSSKRALYHEIPVPQFAVLA